MGLGREERIDGQPECLLDDRRHDLPHHRVVELEGRIGVHAREEHLQVLVQHEVQADEFEVASALRIKQAAAGQHQVQRDLLHLRQDVLAEAVRLVGILCLQVPLEIVVGEFVGRLVAAVVRPGFLEAVGGEVDEWVQVVEQEGQAAGAHVALVVPVDAQSASNRGDEGEVMQVELAPSVKEGPLDVLLQQERPRLLAVLQRFPQLLHDLGSGQQLHLILMVGAFAGLDEPELLLVLEDGEGVEVDVGAGGIADEVGLREDVPRVAALLLLVVVLQQAQQVLGLVEQLVLRDVVGDHQIAAHLRVDELVALPVDQPLHSRLILLRQEYPVGLIAWLPGDFFHLLELEVVDRMPFIEVCALLELVDARHVLLRPVELAVLGISRNLVPEALPQQLLHEKLVISGSHVDPHSGRRGVAEGEVCGEAVGELHFEVEVQQHLQLLHVGVLVVVGIEAERLLLLQLLQLHVPRPPLREVLRSARPASPRRTLAQLPREGAAGLRWTRPFPGFC